MKKTLIALVLASSALAGCSSTPTRTEIVQDELNAQSLQQKSEQEKAENILDSVPAWALEPPKPDSTGVYGVGIGESKKLQLAMQKASLSAQYELAKSVGQELSGNEQSYIKDTNYGTTEQFTKLVDSLVAEVPMQGFETIEQEVVALNGQFTAYKLMKLSYDQLNKALESKENIQGQEQDIKEAFESLQARIAQKTNQ